MFLVTNHQSLGMCFSNYAGIRMYILVENIYDFYFVHADKNVQATFIT